MPLRAVNSGVGPHVDSLAFNLLPLGLSLAFLAGLFASFFSARRQSRRRPWHLAVLIGVPTLISVLGALGFGRPGDVLETRLGLAGIAIVVCGAFFALAYVTASLLVALWRSIGTGRDRHDA
jgi:hypothetical protein